MVAKGWSGCGMKYLDRDSDYRQLGFTHGIKLHSSLQTHIQSKQNPSVPCKSPTPDCTKHIMMESAIGKVIGVITADGEFLMLPELPFEIILSHLICPALVELIALFCWSLSRMKRAVSPDACRLRFHRQFFFSTLSPLLS